MSLKTRRFGDFTPQHVELMTQDENLCLQRSARPQQLRQRGPDQPAEIGHPMDYQPIRGPQSAELGLR